MSTAKPGGSAAREREERDTRRLESLRAFLRRNASALDAIESVVQAATWLLPDDKNSELLLEGLSALMGVLGVIRDTDPTTSGRGSAVPFLRIPPHVLIAVLQQTEVLAEVSAKRFLGEELKWSLLALVEAAKAWGRLQTLYSTGGGLLIENNTPSARARGASGSEEARMQQLLRALASFRSARAPDSAPIVPPPPRPSEPPVLETVLRYLLTGSVARGEPPLPPAEALAIAARYSQQVAQQGFGHVREALLLLARGGVAGAAGLGGAAGAGAGGAGALSAQAGLLYAGETLHILRPLLYCLLRRRYGSRSWKPLAAALGADLLSRAVLTRVVTSEEEKEELRRRKLYLLYYLLYSPAYEVGLQSGMTRAQRRVSAVPGLGLLSRRLVELIDSIQSYHTYVTTA